MFLLRGVSHQTLPFQSLLDTLFMFCDYSMLFSMAIFGKCCAPIKTLNAKDSRGGVFLFFSNPTKQMRTTLDCFKQLCGPAELLSFQGRLASSSYAPFITFFQWPAPSRLRLEGQVGCRLVHNVWGD